MLPVQGKASEGSALSGCCSPISASTILGRRPSLVNGRRGILVVDGKRSGANVISPLTRMVSGLESFGPEVLSVGTSVEKMCVVAIRQFANYPPEYFVQTLYSACFFGVDQTNSDGLGSAKATNSDLGLHSKLPTSWNVCWALQLLFLTI